MCYDSNARPPEPPGEAGAATGEDIELVSADGTRFAAFVARASGGPSRSNVLIYPDVRGLHQFYKELALRLAEQGIDAVAIDYFGRTAGIGSRDESFEYMPHVQQIEFPSFLDDVKAAIAYLHSDGGEGSATFTLGFCMGGALSLLTAAEDLDLSGAIALYAGFGRRFTGTDKSTLERAADISVPVLGLFGGADQGIPASDVQTLDENLDKTGVEHEIFIYPNAPHSFFDRKYAEFADESADAWRRILGFVKAHSGK
ncbi:MAG: dienelactone hydrolase family protein [Chloroflexota bacterium]